MQNNHQALLVVLSYIIGFTTAFILFGVVADQKVHKYMERDNDMEMGMRMMDREGKRPMNTATILENDEGLFLQRGPTQLPISAYTDEAEAISGFHKDIAVSSLSPNGEYVHYCAVMSAGSETCQHYVYVIKEHMIYPVLEASVAYETPATSASEVFWEADSSLNLMGSKASMAGGWTVE